MGMQPVLSLVPHAFYCYSIAIASARSLRFLGGSGEITLKNHNRYTLIQSNKKRANSTIAVDTTPIRDARFLSMTEALVIVVRDSTPFSQHIIWQFVS